MSPEWGGDGSFRVGIFEPIDQVLQTPEDRLIKVRPILFRKLTMKLGYLFFFSFFWVLIMIVHPFNL